ncbi:MAG: creatinine amidohydrolase [Solirubrobacteraceae bacterium]|nr:creatinine amidohydrolase [Solirubrobacteraceae bacterium]
MDVSAPGRRFELAEIAWSQVAELDPGRTAVFLVSGPLEQHGPHLPLGTDVFQATLVLDTIVERVTAAGWNALIAPTLPYTTAVLSRTYPGSVSIRSRHLVGFFADVLNSFAGNGLRDLVVCSQHLDPPHVLAWEEACRQAGRDTGARAIEGYERLVIDDLRTGALEPLLGAWSETDSHAGIFETSVMRVARADLAPREAADRLEPAPVSFDELRAARDFRELANGLGYTGHPAVADEEIGRELVRRYATGFGDLVLEHLAGGDVRERLSIAHVFDRDGGNGTAHHRESLG